MMELVKKEDTKGTKETKPGGLSLSEKKLVASADIQKDAQKTGVVKTVVNGADVSVDNATNLDVARPDDDIKQMLAQLQGGGTGVGTGVGVSESGIGSETGGEGGEIGGMPPLSVNIVKGMLYTVYMIPSYIYRVEYHPDEFTINVKAQQLADILERYGISDVKYIDLIFFGAGVVGDMAGIMGKCKELKEEKDYKRRFEIEKVDDEKIRSENTLRNKEFVKEREKEDRIKEDKIDVNDIKSSEIIDGEGGRIQ